jgi:energy-coupling factor transporter ATP-binding protein EcfA2
MPNGIKYNLSAETLALKKGNFYIATGDVGKGPTSTSGFYNGITPPSSGYTIYLNKESNGPSIYVPSNDSQLISLTNGIAGTSFTGATQCLNYYATQTDKMVFNRDYEGIITNGLVLNLDAGFTPSYSTSGVTWYDLSNSGNNGTLTNGPTFNSSNGGNIVFDGVDDYISCGNSASVQINQGTISAWVKASSPGSGYRGIITKQGNYGLFIRDGVLASYDWGNNQNITTNINIADDSWKHVAMTFTTNTGTPSNNAIIYLNGSAVLTTTIKYSVDNVGLQIGNGGDAVQYISGNIAGASLYNRPLSAAEILQNYNAQKSRYIPFDTDAQAFITAAEITDSTQQNAINQLVLDLKSYSLWTKMRAIYPFVGGTATTHKFNLKDPRDLDAAYRLVFNGGITHSNTGALPNGTNGYADTYVNTSVVNFPTTNYISMGYYSRTGGSHSTGGNVMGSFGSPSFQATSARILIRYVGNPNSSLSAFNYVDSVLPNALTTTDTVGTGMYIGTRSSTASKLFVRGSLAGNTNSGNTAFSLPPYNAFLFAYNNRDAGALNYTNKECAFAHIGVGLTDSECTNLTTIVNTFQTTLGRNV